MNGNNKIENLNMLCQAKENFVRFELLSTQRDVTEDAKQGWRKA